MELISNYVIDSGDKVRKELNASQINVTDQCEAAE
jgi:hypothetical protein